MLRNGYTTGQYRNSFLVEFPAGHPVGPSFEARLYNFAVNSDVLRTDHKLFLQDVVVPMIEKVNPKFIIAYGHCSRTGSASYNQTLGMKRARAVITYLHRLMPIHYPISRSYATEGEDSAERHGRHDGSEEGLDRAVTLEFADKRGFRAPVGIERAWSRYDNSVGHLMAV